MRQTSSLAALVGRISREILPPVRALWARRVECSGTAGEKGKQKPRGDSLGLCFEVTGQNYNSQFFTIYSLDYTFFNIDFRNNIFIILATNTKYYFGFVDILYKMINRN